MIHLVLTQESLKRALGNMTARAAVQTLRCLKEAAIYDQSFDYAIVLRDAEKRLTGGKSGINTPPAKKTTCKR